MISLVAAGRCHGDIFVVLIVRFWYVNIFLLMYRVCSWRNITAVVELNKFYFAHCIFILIAAQSNSGYSSQAVCNPVKNERISFTKLFVWFARNFIKQDIFFHQDAMGMKRRNNS
jgi:hypothetical protein